MLSELTQHVKRRVGAGYHSAAQPQPRKTIEHEAHEQQPNCTKKNKKGNHEVLGEYGEHGENCVFRISRDIIPVFQET
jgi:hypothetical protein